MGTRLHRHLGSLLAAVVAMGALTPAAIADVLPRFPPGSFVHRNITTAPLATNSATMINTLATTLGGWGNGNKFQIDFSIIVVHAPAGAPTKPLLAWPDASGYCYGGGPDCEAPGLAIPLPAGGMVEGSPTNDYHCDNSNNDCHLIVVQGTKLYEIYQANLAADNSGVEGIVGVLWDLAKVYPPQGRGEQCTSADAGGFPIAPMLFSADEVYAATQVANGDLGHAIRFILPNTKIVNARYVHPGSHGTKPPGGASGPANTVPYAARLRLKSNFNMSNYNAAAQVILRTMQRYGIVLADGGNIALTGEADNFNTHKWSELGITSQVFNPGVGNPAVAVTDFDVVETGPQIVLTYDCVRTPDDFIFIDPFDY